jgi:hypothetical protein
MKTIFSKSIYALYNQAVSMGRKIALTAFAILVIEMFPIVAHATTYVNVNFDSSSCNTRVYSGTLDGAHFDVSTSTIDALAFPYIRCSLSAPSGNNYVQWDVPQVNPAADPHGTGPDITFSTPITVVSGKTYYLAAYWRFERINGNAIWHSTWDFDKLIEMTGTGFRWIIESGYVEEANPYSPNNFIFTVYASDAIFPGWTYYSHNKNGYSMSAPLKSNYETWHSVVMGITAHVSNGTIKLWVDGTQVIETTGKPTMLSTATISRITMSGTVGQPGYDAPPHRRQVDKIMLTDNFQDIVNAGYLTGASSVKPSAPVALP